MLTIRGCFLFRQQCYWIILHRRFINNRRVVLMKVTCCFDESDDLFLKVTWCFDVNDVLFWWNRRVVLKKWRVVLLQPTSRFWWTIRCCFCPIGNRKSVSLNQSSEMGIFRIVKIPIIVSLARTRTRASQEFYCFCCHKCHTVVDKVLYYRRIKFSFGVF